MKKSRKTMDKKELKLELQVQPVPASNDTAVKEFTSDITIIGSDGASSEETPPRSFGMEFTASEHAKMIREVMNDDPKNVEECNNFVAIPLTSDTTIVGSEGASIEETPPRSFGMEFTASEHAKMIEELFMDDSKKVEKRPATNDCVIVSTDDNVAKVLTSDTTIVGSAGASTDETPPRSFGMEFSASQHAQMIRDWVTHSKRDSDLKRGNNDLNENLYIDMVEKLMEAFSANSIITEALQKVKNEIERMQKESEQVDVVETQKKDSSTELKDEIKPSNASSDNLIKHHKESSSSDQKEGIQPSKENTSDGQKDDHAKDKIDHDEGPFFSKQIDIISKILGTYQDAKKSFKREKVFRAYVFRCLENECKDSADRFTASKACEHRSQQHTGEAICSTTFISASVTYSKDEDEDVYKCEFCGFKTISWNEMRNHYFSNEFSISENPNADKIKKMNAKLPKSLIFLKK